MTDSVAGGSIIGKAMDSPMSANSAVAQSSESPRESLRTILLATSSDSRSTKLNVNLETCIFLRHFVSMLTLVKRERGIKKQRRVCRLMLNLFALGWDIASVICSGPRRMNTHCFIFLCKRLYQSLVCGENEKFRRL